MGESQFRILPSPTAFPDSSERRSCSVPGQQLPCWSLSQWPGESLPSGEKEEEETRARGQESSSRPFPQAPEAQDPPPPDLRVAPQTAGVWGDPAEVPPPQQGPHGEVLRQRVPGRPGGRQHPPEAQGAHRSCHRAGHQPTATERREVQNGCSPQGALGRGALRDRPVADRDRGGGGGGGRGGAGSVPATTPLLRPSLTKRRPWRRRSGIKGHSGLKWRKNN